MARKVYCVLYVVVIVATVQAMEKLYDSYGLVEAAAGVAVGVLIGVVLTKLIIRTFIPEDPKAS